MLGMIEDKRRRVNLSKLPEMGKNRDTWCAAVLEIMNSQIPHGD